MLKKNAMENLLSVDIDLTCWIENFKKEVITFITCDFGQYVKK